MTDRAAFNQARLDRTRRYAGRVLDPAIAVALTVEDTFLATAAGQAATITAANLLGRMTEAIVLEFANLQVYSTLPWRGRRLHDVISETIASANPFAAITSTAPPGTYRLHLGAETGPWLAHGSGWNAYVGPGPSPLPPPEDDNIFGAVFAAIHAVAKLFETPFPECVRATLANTFDWTEALATDAPRFSRPHLGEVWLIGAGSVGSAAAYFLALAGIGFTCSAFDMDRVKVENLDRSPIFTAAEAEAGTPKVDSVARFLRGAGIPTEPVPQALDEVDRWTERRPGPPDLIISAANERNVRYLIEMGFPPVQLYGTTGRQWQSALIRHVPPSDPCSCCLFPPDAPAATGCATGTAAAGAKTEQIDASLPFLSFAAGLMTAAEAAKLGLPGYPFSANRVLYYPRSEPILHQPPLSHRGGCACLDRSRPIHRAIIAGTRHEGLCDFEAPGLSTDR